MSIRVTDIRPGDHVRFRACTRWQDGEQSRQVLGAYPHSKFQGPYITVACHGRRDFVVLEREILEHTPARPRNAPLKDHAA